MRRIIWALAALDDLRGVRDYIGQFNPAAASRLALALIAKAESLRDLPERGRSLGGGRRELVVVWPYVIRYRVEGETIVILRVRHGARLQQP